MKYLVFNIKWDINDGERLTPPEMIVDVPVESSQTRDNVEQYLTDEISNITGWCHDGYEFEPVPEEPDHKHPSTECKYLGFGIWDCGVTDQH